MAKNDSATVERRDRQSQENLARLIGSRPSHFADKYHDISYGRTRTGTSYVANRLRQQRRKYVAGNRTGRSAQRKDATWALAVAAVVMMVIVEIVLRWIR